MQMIKFVNRARELGFLKKQYSRKGTRLVIIYGRRRTGKTELIKEFQKGKPHIYFLCDKKGTKPNAVSFAEISADFFNDVRPEADNFDDVFLYIVKRMPSNKKLIITIDEFSYLVEKDDSIPSVFQKIVDEIIKDKQIMLILCGSSISMMYKGTLSYKAPLYGRRTGYWQLKPLKFKEVCKFFPKSNIEQIIKAYAVFGNIPAYLAVVSPEMSIERNIIEKIMGKGSDLYREPEILLQEEVREPSSYISIFEGMTASTKASQIASKAGIKAKDLPKYFKTLENLQLIRREIPVTEKKSKKSLYFINDKLFEFWFKFCSKNKSYLEEGRESYIFNKSVKPALNRTFSFAFEETAMEALEYLTPFNAEKTGRWWGAYRDKTGKRQPIEIDIIALNEKTREILFAECKWKNRVNAEKILKELKEKSQHVQWNNEKRKEYYAIFAKSFKKKFKQKNIHLYDLKDLEKAFKK